MGSNPTPSAIKSILSQSINALLDNALACTRFCTRSIAPLVAAIIFSSPAGADIRITSDQGGELDQYLQRVEAVRQSGERVIIDGPCNSACTLWLSLPPAQLCVTPRAVFGFHSAMDPVTGMPSPRWNAALIRAYPPHVRDLISRRGGLWWTARDDLHAGHVDCAASMAVARLAIKAKNRQFRRL